jgi:hypothetical protein
MYFSEIINLRLSGGQSQPPLRDLSATYRDTARQDSLREFRLPPLIKPPVLGSVREVFTSGWP